MLIFKNAFIKIKNQLGRFISLVFIVALGSAFFAGVRETSSDMIKTLDEYYDETNLMDFRIISTMGLTEDDLNALKDLNHSYLVEENYSYETVITGDATKIYGLTDTINNVTLIDGTMPKNNNECLVMEGSYNIGDTITIEDNNYSDYLSTNTFTVTGTVRSSMYVYKNLGISTVSDGKLDNVIYIPKDTFTMDYYTEIYLIAKDSQEATSYEDDYTKTVNALLDELELLAPIQETKRYEQIKTEAMESIYDAREEIEEKRNKNETKFADALAEINANQTKINNGYQEINNGLAELEKQKIQIEQELSTQETTLNNALATINNTLNSLGIPTTSINDSLNALKVQETNLNNLLTTLDPTSEEYALYNTQLNNLKTIISNLNEINNGYTTLNEGKTTWNNTYNETLNTLNSSKAELDKNQSTLNTAIEEYNANYATFQNELAKGYQEIADAEAEIANLEKPEWYLFDREDNSNRFYRRCISHIFHRRCLSNVSKHHD